MTLAEFRRLTAHLAGERELLCAGAEINIVWHDETDAVSIDDGYVDVDDRRRGALAGLPRAVVSGTGPQDCPRTHADGGDVTQDIR